LALGMAAVLLLVPAVIVAGAAAGIARYFGSAKAIRASPPGAPQ